MAIFQSSSDSTLFLMRKRYLNATFEHDPSIPLHFILVLEGTESKRNCKINLLRGFIFNYLQFLTSTN